jgi:site-specific DNA-adenine methylase
MDFHSIKKLATQDYLFSPTSMGITRSDRTAWQDTLLTISADENCPDPTTSHKKYVKSTPPTFSYPGGKAKMAKLLVEMMPESGRAYVEPFAGRANVFWVAALELNYKEWHLNDIRTADWFACIRDYGHDVVVPECNRMEYNKRLADFKNGCPYARMLEPYLTYSGAGFGAGGYRSNKKGGSTQGGFQQSIQMAQHILHATGATVTSADWKEAVAGLGADDFVYFDPPYLDCNVTAYRPSDLDHMELVHHLLEAPYRWMLSEYDQPLYRDALGVPCLQKKAKTRHGAAREECLWKNF